MKERRIPMNKVKERCLECQGILSLNKDLKVLKIYYCENCKVRYIKEIGKSKLIQKKLFE